MVRTRNTSILNVILSATTLPLASSFYFGNSMAECERFALQFKNTCDTSLGKPANVASIPGQVVTCADTGDYCIDSGNFDPSTSECSWNRKLCVTCESSGTSRVKINVQSNGLPAECFYAPDRQMVEQNIEYSVDFNVY